MSSSVADINLDEFVDHLDADLDSIVDRLPAPAGADRVRLRRARDLLTAAIARYRGGAGVEAVR